MKVGDIVIAPYGRVPKTADGRWVVNNRPKNMIEQARWEQDVKAVEWEQQYVCVRVERIEGEYLWAGGHRFKVAVCRLAD